MAEYTISSREGTVILLATILASCMAFLDGTVVTIAVPVFQLSLHATLSDIQWVVNRYTLMLSALILIAGALGDKLGRKRVFLFGIGMSIVIAPLTKSSLSVDKAFSGAASGVNNAVARIAGLLAVALLCAIILPIFTTTLQQKINNSSLTPLEKQQIISQSDSMAAIRIPQSFTPQTKQLIQQNIETSFLSGFRIIMFINVFLALLAAGVSYLTIHNKNNG